MGVFNAAGARLTRTAFPAADAPDPLKRVTADVYATRAHDAGTRPSDSRDGVPEGSIKTLLYKTGTILRASQIDALFPPAAIAAVSPQTGPAAGGTVVTITGTNLDGVTEVKFGATAGTALKVLSSGKLRVTTPAATAGAVNVVAADDAGPVTKTGGFTFA
ncbi:IPT/TIG domain-containing protein [Streptomyces sp. BV286]|uniref:IPT/TIG domain-containing protein n=1 Tax=Streptomyces sp. BV286 TaxID=2849672 RepID=UPI001C2E7311|nr:IPT/TIG domain-containing protein [Streptomyces sp. BV286]MBV1940759.1 IPT/TIG domain-containing protein [Streptomyces sp. BV286]